MDCDSLLSSVSSWTLSSPVAMHGGSSGCACCSSSKLREASVRKLTVSFSEDECDSDADTQSPSSSISGLSDEQPEEPEESSVSVLEQSPIDIRVAECDAVYMDECGEDVSIQVGEADAEVAFDGAGFQVHWSQQDQLSELTIGGKVFRAIQLHFHTPSEHTLDGQHEAMEMHIVHHADDGCLAVVAVFFREGNANPLLAQFWDALSGLEYGQPATLPVGTIDPRKLDLLSGSFFRYRGSLTTPPYTEGVEWVVVQDVAEASFEQVETFRELLRGPNARPVQSLNEREVRLVQ